MDLGNTNISFYNFYNLYFIQTFSEKQLYNFDVINLFFLIWWIKLDRFNNGKYIDYNYFYFLISFCSIIKPTYFIFSILPLFLQKKINLKEIYKILASFLIILIIYLYSYLNNSELFYEFLYHLEYGRSEEFKNIFGQGFGLFSIISHFTSLVIKTFQLKINISLTSNIIWISIILLFIYYSLFIKNKEKELLFNEKIAYGICVITFCYPLLKHYECFLVIPSIYFLISNYKTNFKYLMIVFMFCVHDKYAILFLLSLTLFYETLLTNKKYNS